MTSERSCPARHVATPTYSSKVHRYTRWNTQVERNRGRIMMRFGLQLGDDGLVAAALLLLKLHDKAFNLGVRDNRYMGREKKMF